MPLNFLNLGIDINLQIQEAEWTLKMIKPKKSTISHIIKLLKMKNKEKNLDSSQKEMTQYIGNNNSNDSRFLIRNHGVRKKWHIFQVMKEKNFSPEFYLQSKYSSRPKVEKKERQKRSKPKQGEKQSQWRKTKKICCQQICI